MPSREIRKDLEYILKFLGYSAVYGIPLNFSIWAIFGITFNFYSWLAWGIALWFIENKFIPLVRNIIIR